MVVTLDVPPELECSLRAAARAIGVEPAQWAGDMIARLLRQTAEPPCDQYAAAESDRLRKLLRERQAKLRAMLLDPAPARTGEERTLQKLVVEKMRDQGVTGGLKP